MDVDIQADWQEGQRARGKFLENQPALVFAAAQLIRRCHVANGRCAIYGKAQLSALATYGSRLFLSGGIIGQGPKLPLFDLNQMSEIKMLGGPHDCLIWLTLNPVDEIDASLVAEAHARGLKVIVIACAPGEYLEQISDHRVIVPTRHLVVASELVLSTLHSLYKMSSESEIPLTQSGIEKKRQSGTRRMRRPSADKVLPKQTAKLGVKAPAKRSATRPVTRALNRMSSGNLARFRCGACREVITVERQLAGEKFPCPNCGQVVVIPGGKPAKVATESSEKRRATRFPVHHGRALFKLKSGWLEHGEAIEDVSLTGVGIRLIRRELSEFDQSQALTMALDFPAFREPIRVNGRIRRVVKREGKVVIGIEFTEMSETSRQRLERLQSNAALRNVKRR